MKTITDKIDETTFIPDEYKKTVIPPPHSVKVELTRKCNYKCGFCVNSRLVDKGHMSLENFRTIAQKIYDAGVRSIAPFYFGESFIVPYLPDAVRIAKEIGFPYIFLTTNGSVSTPEKIKACMEAGLNSLKFSLNHADEEQFQQITNVSVKNFYKMKENIKSAWKIREEGKYDCGLFASYIQYTGEQGEKMKGIIDELSPYLDEIYPLPLFSQAGEIENEDWEFIGGNPGRADNPRPIIPCWTLFKEAHINYDGSGNACCFGIADERFIHGNLLEQSFDEVWNHEKIQKLREAHLAGNIKGTPCEGCIIQRV